MNQKCVKIHVCKAEFEKIFQNRNHQWIFNLSFMWNSGTNYPKVQKQLISRKINQMNAVSPKLRLGIILTK
jgi:hypothetical protein